MIAKANAMNSTTFARGRTVAGKVGMTAGWRRDEHSGRSVARSVLGRLAALRRATGATSDPASKPGLSTFPDTSPISGGLITFDARHLRLGLLHRRRQDWRDGR